MFKKEFGISVYPEKSNLKEIEQYLKTAQKYGFQKLFLSWMQIKESKNYFELYRKTIQLAKQLGFYVVLDINDSNFKFYETLGIDCLRLDSPLLPKEVADLTYQTDLDLQLNISNNDSFINNVLEYEPVKENIYGCHNFYPLQFSGLGWDFFQESTKKFNELGIHTSAFVSSQFGIDGPQKFKLVHGAPTVEKLRNLPIRSQVKYLLGTKQIDAIYIANQFASEEELKSFATLNTKVVELDLTLNSEKISILELEILQKIDHFSRGDINENFIRSTMNRKIYQDAKDIQPLNEKKMKVKKGDVLIWNVNEPNYQKELMIIKQTDLNIDLRKANLVGQIKDYDQDLIDLIQPWQHFKFKIV